MRFDIITIFPEDFSYLESSMIKRARERGFIDIHIHNLRDYAREKHKTVDEKPYGGGPGMVFKAEPLARAIGSVLGTRNKRSAIMRKKTLVVLFSAGGKQFGSKMAVQWAKKLERMIFIAGHYEGIDERIKKIIRDSGLMLQEISIGPYVLTGGELPAMVVVDAVSRHIEGVLGKERSLEENRFGVGVSVYTRPENFIWRGKNYRVPKVLLSGDHAKISAWRRKHKSQG